MKKFGSLLMSTLLCASLLAGCSSSASVSQSTVPETISTAEGAIETGSEEVSLEEMTAAKTETSTEALEESSDDTVVRVGGLKGPTTMGLVKLMDDAKNGTAANNYEFTMVTAAAPVLTRSADVRRLDAAAQRLFALTARAEEQYVLAYPSLAAARPGSAWTTDPVIL